MNTTIRIKVDGVDIVDLATMIQALVDGNKNTNTFPLWQTVVGVFRSNAQLIRMNYKKANKEIFDRRDVGAALGLIYKYCPEAVEHIGKDWSRAGKTEKKKLEEDYTRDEKGKIKFEEYD